MLKPRILKSPCFFFFLAFIFLFCSHSSLSQAQNQPKTILDLPEPGTLVKFSEAYTPTLIKGITINPDNALEFDFIIDKGDSGLIGDEFTREANKLIKYFMAALTVPEAELWVNLSPHENDRVIPDNLGITEMGRDLLAQDYLLKQLTASLMYPKEALGQKFWDQVHKKARKLYGTTEIPMNTFNKIWIIPKKAMVLEHEGTAYVVESELKVMLQEDYLTLQEEMGEDALADDNGPAKESNEITSEVVREVLLPEIEKEINTGKTFANLRQINNAIILAEWYKRTLKESLLGKIYVDKNKVTGVDLADKTMKNKIFDQYVRSFIKGAFNFVEEDYDKVNQTTVFRKYFSGGAEINYRKYTDTFDIVSSRQPSGQRPGDSAPAGVGAPAQRPGQAPRRDLTALIADVADDLDTSAGRPVAQADAVRMRVSFQPVKPDLPDAARQAPVVVPDMRAVSAPVLAQQATAAAVEAARPSERWVPAASLFPDADQVEATIETLRQAGGARNRNMRLRPTSSGDAVLEIDTTLGFDAMPEPAKVQQQAAVSGVLAQIQSSRIAPDQVQGVARQLAQRGEPISEDMVVNNPTVSMAVRSAEQLVQKGVVTGSDVKSGQSLTNQPVAVQTRAFRALDAALQVQTGQRPVVEPALASRAVTAVFQVAKPTTESYTPLRAVSPEQTNDLKPQAAQSGGLMRVRTTDAGAEILEINTNADLSSLPEPARLQIRRSVTDVLSSVQSSGIPQSQILTASRQAAEAAERREPITPQFRDETPAGRVAVQAADQLIQTGVIMGSDIQPGQSVLNQPLQVQSRAFRAVETALQVQTGGPAPAARTAILPQAAATAFQQAAASTGSRWVPLTLTPQQTERLADQIQSGNMPGLRLETRDDGGRVVLADASAGYVQTVPSEIRSQHTTAVNTALDQVRTSSAPRGDIRQALRTADAGESLSPEFWRSPVGRAADTLFQGGVVPASGIQPNQPLSNQRPAVQAIALRSLDSALAVGSGSMPTDAISTASAAASEAHYYAASSSPLTQQWIPVTLPQPQSTALVQSIQNPEQGGVRVESGYTYSSNQLTRITPDNRIEIQASAPIESLPPPVQGQLTQGMRDVSDLLQKAQQEKVDSRYIQSRLSTVIGQTQRNEAVGADFGNQRGADQVIRTAAQRVIDSGIVSPANIRPGTPLTDLSAQDQSVVLGALDRGIQEIRRAEIRDFAKGGIDLNPDMLDFQIKRDGRGVPLPTIQQPLESLDIQGFLPVIVDIAPVTNVPQI